MTCCNTNSRLLVAWCSAIGCVSIRAASRVPGDVIPAPFTARSIRGPVMPWINWCMRPTPGEFGGSGFADEAEVARARQLPNSSGA